MNFRMSCVVIFLALCLMNVHSLSKGSKGNDTSTGQLKEFQKYFTEKPEEMKKFRYWRAMQQKKQANETTHELNKTTKPVLKSSSKEKLSTRPLSTPTILSEIPTKPVTQKPNPPTSKTTKSVADTISKPSTKIPSSRQKSPTSKTATSKSVTEIPSKPSTKTPTSKQKSPTSKIMPAKSETETTSKPKTKTRTPKQKSPTSKTTTAKNVTDIPSNSSTKNATTTAKQLPSTSEPTMSKDGNTLPSSKTKQAESITDQFVQRSHFGVIFLVILVVIVAVYFGYHNRNKIHKFIKRGFSTSKHIGPGYLKVKLEDDVDLPREANRQYIY